MFLLFPIKKKREYKPDGRPTCLSLFCKKVSPTAGKPKNGVQKYTKFCTDCRRKLKKLKILDEKTKNFKEDKIKYGGFDREKQRYIKYSN